MRRAGEIIFLLGLVALTTGLQRPAPSAPPDHVVFRSVEPPPSLWDLVFCDRTDLDCHDDELVVSGNHYQLSGTGYRHAEGACCWRGDRLYLFDRDQGEMAFQLSGRRLTPVDPARTFNLDTMQECR